MSNASIIWHKLQCNSILARYGKKWYKYLNIFLFQLSYSSWLLELIYIILTISYSSWLSCHVCLLWNAWWLYANSTSIRCVKFLVFNTPNTKKPPTWNVSNARIIWHKLPCNSILTRYGEKLYKYLDIFLFQLSYSSWLLQLIFFIPLKG